MLLISQTLIQTQSSDTLILKVWPGVSVTQGSLIGMQMIMCHPTPVDPESAFEQNSHVIPKHRQLEKCCATRKLREARCFVKE